MIFSRYPSEDSIAKISAGANEVIDMGGASYLTDYLEDHRLRLALDFEWVSLNIEKREQILEVGAFPYFLTNAMLGNGYAVDALDKMTSKSASLAGRNNLSVKTCDIEIDSFPCDDNNYHHVLFNEVFEHLRINPIHALREALRVLRPGGRLWLSTPNLGSLKGLYNLLIRNESWTVVSGGVYSQYIQIEESGHMGHVREYTSRDVTEFLKCIGFQVSQLQFRGFNTNPLVGLLYGAIPRLRPFFTCIAVKPSAP